MFYLSKRAFQAPEHMVDLIWNWVLSRYASVVYQNTQDPELKRKSGNDCGFNTFSDFTTTIPLSLNGWKYNSKEFQDALKFWDTKVKVSLFVSDAPEYYGLYNDYNNSIDIVLYSSWLNPTINEYEKNKLSIHKTIIHELQHLGQYIFKHFKSLKDIGGIPSRSISNKNYSPEGQENVSYEEKPYHLRDIEFYPILNDAKIEMKSQIDKWPQLKNEIFKRYIGLIPSFHPSEPQLFLQDLKQNEPDKWNKAVKFLYKEIL